MADGGAVSNSPASADYQRKGEKYFNQPREDLLPLLPQVMGSIADIGGGAGATLTLVKEHYPNARTICVDRHGPAIAKARACGHVGVLCDLQASIPEEIEQCDVVVCLDVLEHLVDPWSVLEKIHARMKPGAQVVISLPNVRYWPVSSGLLFGGRWNLTSQGVLDDTHLRFFTKSTAIALLQNAHFQLTRVVGKLGPSPRAKAADALTFGLLRDLFVIQYLLVGTR